MNNAASFSAPNMLAVVIPFHRIKYFSKTIGSLINQTNLNFTVYIGDDCSEDRIGDNFIFNEMPFDVFYTRFNENMGRNNLGGHFSRCVDLCRDEPWVMILGDDDFLEKSCVQEFYNNLETIKKNDIDVIRFATTKINQDGNEISEKFVHDKIQNSKTSFIENLKGKRGSLSEIIFNKAKLKELDFNLLPLAWMLDWYALLKCSNFGNILSINESSVYVRYGGHSISGSSDMELEKLKNYATFKCIKTVLTENPEEFNPRELTYLRMKFEKTYFNHKKNKEILLEVIKYYLSRFKLLNLTLFLFKSLGLMILSFSNYLRLEKLVNSKI